MLSGGERVTERVCMESGEWTGEAPTCSYVDCGVPAPIENGQIELQEILDNMITDNIPGFCELSFLEQHDLKDQELQLIPKYNLQKVYPCKRYLKLALKLYLNIK